MPDSLPNRGDLPRIRERRSQRLIDEDGLVRREDRLHLFEVYAAVAAFEQDRVHVLAERRNVGIELDLPLSPQFFGVPLTRLALDSMSGLPPLYAATITAPLT